MTASVVLRDRAELGPQPTRTRALLLINRRARRGTGDLSAALDVLRTAGFDIVAPPVERPSQLSDVIRQNRHRVSAVIIGGGDGTLTMAADGLIGAGLPLGILPLGTANDLARTLGLPLDPLPAAKVIAAGQMRRIDLGWVNGTHFFNVATVGLGAGVTRRLNRERKSRWGVLAYLFAAAQVVTRARPFAADIRTESGTTRVQTVQVTVGNGRYFGGGMTLDDSAGIADGVLHLVSLEVRHWSELVRLVPSMWRGTLRTKPNVRAITGREFEVIPVKKKRRKVTADGELAGRTPAHFRVVPAALSVFVPGNLVADTA